VAPDLAVYLHRDARAAAVRRFGEDAARRERLHGAVQRFLGQDVGQDVGPREVAHLLYEDDLELAAHQRGLLGRLEISPVVLAVGDDGVLNHVGCVAVLDVQLRPVTPEKHLERGERQLVVKTATLEETIEEWSSSALRRAQSLHSGTILAYESGLSLSRATPMPPT